MGKCGNHSTEGVEYKKNEKFPENVLDTFMCTQRVSPFFSKKVGKSNFKKLSIHYLEFLDY